ncbi:hypothetical protein [Flavobacterium branchiicola]|uniref:Uncharacterized protein n=1 Tax=Flavobacterium branchiicola TaxID=1114875 RepID=A0ABV9PF13_9FLAO|nr:hypothetical protein [Flavobacterium branchiicola]MBS7255336.1 hypothetical protein [Flavobacterium branchiicola]
MQIRLILSNRSLIIVFFLFLVQVLFGQNNSASSDDWDKIIIIDSKGGFSSFENKFQIQNQKFWLTPLEKPDSIIKKVDSKLVSELVRLLTQKDSVSFDQPLVSFGRDSLWLVSNAEKLWKAYAKKTKTTEIDSIAISIIKDYEKANKVALSLQGSVWTDDYPLVVVNVIKEKDTLSAYSFGQYPYMLPWILKKRKVYNSKIPEVIAELLPDIFPSNKERLSGQDFDNSFIGGIYGAFLADKESYLEARNKYPRTFRALKKEFEITKAEIMDMSSIEWGGDSGRMCLEMYLKDVEISKNIQFNTISGANELLGTKRSIIYKKDNLIRLLQDNPVYKYTLSCDTCLGEIHWVKSKSLSLEAQNNFKEDLEENGIDKNKYDGQYKDAIFYELTEHTDSRKSFSRWIFLKNGTLILWQLQGDYLMNFPKDFFDKKGYICKEIKL